MDHGKVIALGTPRELIASIGVEHMGVLTGRPADALDQPALRRLEGVRDVRSENGSVQLQVAELHRAVPALLDELERQGVRSPSCGRIRPPGGRLCGPDREAPAR